MSLAAIKAAGSNPYYMTAAEGMELANKGHIVVNPNDCSPTNPQAFRVMLTSAGEAALAASTGAARFAIRSDIAVPVIKRGNPALKRGPRVPIYPFDLLEVGQSFHVPVTPEDAEPWKKIASSTNAANAKALAKVVPEVMETKSIRKLSKDAEGKPILDAEGKKVYTETQVTEPKTYATKKFKCCKVGATDPDGVGCRVFRVL
jgi:hypothetical protein